MIPNPLYYDESHYVHIGLGLARTTNNNFDYRNIQDRVKELGIENLVSKTTNKYSIDIPDRFLENESDNYLKEIERKMWSLGEKLKKRGIFKTPSLKDIQNAINFLEVFSFYTAQTKLEHIQGDRHKVKYEKLAKVINKAIERIEDFNDTLNLGKDLRKKTLPSKITKLMASIDKEFSEHLTLTEQMALSKKVNLAKEIINKYVSKL